jgi:hypothetical protein
MRTCPSDARYQVWQRAARLLLDGADAEPLTMQIELAPMLDGQFDIKFANDPKRRLNPGLSIHISLWWSCSSSTLRADI